MARARSTLKPTSAAVLVVEVEGREVALGQEAHDDALGRLVGIRLAPRSARPGRRRPGRWRPMARRPARRAARRGPQPAGAGWSGRCVSRVDVGGIAGRIREAGRLNRAHYGETQHYGKMIVGPPGGGPACRVYLQFSRAAIAAARMAKVHPPRKRAADRAARRGRLRPAIAQPGAFRRDRACGLAATRAGAVSWPCLCIGVALAPETTLIALAGHHGRARSCASSCCARWRCGSSRTRCRSRRRPSRKPSTAAALHGAGAAVPRGRRGPATCCALCAPSTIRPTGWR